MRTQLPTLIALFFLLMLTACQAPVAAPAPAATDAPPTEAPEPTATAVPPTEVPEPTATSVPPTATSVPQPVEEPMVGTWMLTSKVDDVYMQLNADGTFVTARLYKDLEKFPTMKGIYEIDGDVLSFTVDPGRTLHCDGETGQYTILPVGADQFHLEKLAWDCFQFLRFVASDLVWERFAEES
jgi:hypothetical protein